MGRKNKAQAKPELTEDELLEQAMRDNAAAAEAAASCRPPPTPAEVVAKLDKVMLLNVVATVEGKDWQIVPGVDGDLCWYADVFDGKAALAAMQAKMPATPGNQLGLDFTPLGRAYSLSQGWTKRLLEGKVPPMRLQPSTKVLETCGAEGIKSLESQLPKVLKQANARQGPFPLFFLEELQSERVMPFFFTREDLVTCWVSSGKPFEDIPAQLNAIDLRALVARMLSEPSDWLERLLIVPPQCLIDLMQFMET